MAAEAVPTKLEKEWADGARAAPPHLTQAPLAGTGQANRMPFGTLEQLDGSA